MRGRVARRLVPATAALAALVPLASAQAIPPEAPDANAPVADGPVYAIAHAPGGNTYIGGEFNNVGTRAGRGVTLASPGSAAPGATGTGLVQAPAPGSPTFPEVSGGEIKAVESDGNGGWFIGGTFTRVGGADLPRLAHILPTGVVNAAWRPAPSANSGASSVNALAVAEPTEVSGNPILYVGGDFHSVASDNRDYMAAFALNASRVPTATGTNGNNANKSLTTWTPGQAAAAAGTAGGGPVHALETITAEVQISFGDPIVQDSKTMTLVIAGGDFTKIGKTGASLNHIAGVWGVGAEKDDVVGGDESLPDPYSGEAATSGTSVGSTSAGTVRAIAVGPTVRTGDVAGGSAKDSTTVYVGGDFTTPGNLLVALKLEVAVSGSTSGDGTEAFSHYSNWKPSVGAPNVSIDALALSGDSQTVYLGGRLSTLGVSPEPAQARSFLGAVAGIPTAQITNATCNGTTDCPATVRPFAPNADGRVRSLALSGGNIVAGGDFDNIGGQQRDGLAALDGTSGAALGWNPKLAGGPVNALATDADSVYAGGAFSMVGAVGRKNIAAIGPAGNVLDAFATGTSCESTADHPCIRAEVDALALSPDASRLFVGGAFTKVQGAERVHLAALDLQTGEVVPGWRPDPDFFNTTTGLPSGTGWVMALDGTGNTLYAGGAFNRMGGAGRSKIAALDMTTGEVVDWNPNAGCSSPPCSIHTIEASCGSVYAGGDFNTIGGQARKNIAALNPVGSTGAGTATAWNPDSSSYVDEIERSGTTIFVGGQFSLIGGKTRSKIAALDAGTGAALAGWNPSVSGVGVDALAISGDASTVYAGGVFFEIGGANREGLAALDSPTAGDGSGDATAWNPVPAAPLVGSSPATHALETDGDNVFAGGRFGEVGSRTQSGYSSFTGAPDPAAEPDHDAADVVACENAAPPTTGVTEPVPQPAPQPTPQITNVRLTKKLKLIYELSTPATVEIDLERRVPGFELPVKEEGKPSGDGSGSARGKGDGGEAKPTVCEPASKRSRRAATKLATRQLGKRLNGKSARERRRLIARELAKLSCDAFKPEDELTDEGEVGKNELKLGGKEGLDRARYRVTLLALTASGAPTAPVALDFRVLADGLAETVKPGTGGDPEGENKQ